MIMYARALYSSFKVQLTALFNVLLKSYILFDNHKRFCWLSVILTYSTS